MCAWLFSIFLPVSSPFPSRRHQFYRCECYHPHGSPTSRPMLTTHRRGIFGYSIVSRPKRTPIGKATLHPPGRQSCGYKSEAQSPALGTSHFEIGWDILEGRERLWVSGLSFCVYLFFCFSIFVFTCSQLSHTLFLLKNQTIFSLSVHIIFVHNKHSTT
jgi:hypothetical protein